jgi:hypothetical protein
LTINKVEEMTFIGAVGVRHITKIGKLADKDIASTAWGVAAEINCQKAETSLTLSGSNPV